MKLLKRIAVVVLIVLGITLIVNYPKLNIISGFASKSMASNRFIAHRSAASIIENDHNVPLIRIADVATDGDNATATVYGLMKRKAVCKEGLGCVLINGDFDRASLDYKPNRSAVVEALPFPYGSAGPKDTLFENVDYRLLQKAIDGAFENPEFQKTRTVLVAYKNEIIAERYTEGFTHDTPILGWSMTKSVLATLFGILQYNGTLDLDEAVALEAWQNDDRKNISLNHLLRMQSGLAWDENYDGISDVTKMLFLDDDMTLAQKDKKAIANPGEVWNYSSGTTNLLSGILRDRFNDHQVYLDYPYAALIDKIGMHSMLIEVDMNGNFVGSSYGWANTRDWAKFGLLYLNHGNWNGEQLFDSNWVRYITKPTNYSNGTYGAHFWLNSSGVYPDVPRDLYSANGYQGQFVFVIPSKDLVVVRTGLAESPDFDINKFLKEVVEAIK